MIRSAFIDVKTGSPDPVDFATTRLLLPRLWKIAQHTAANCYSNTPKTCGSSQKKNKMLV
jgi:hypothetical protein